MVIALVVVVGSAVPAGAHTYTGFYQRGRWKECGASCAGGQIPFFFTASFPTGAWRERVRNGVQAWNALRPARYRWLEYPPTGDFEAVTTCPPVPRRNGVHLRHLANYRDQAGDLGRFLAVTKICSYVSDPSRIHSANVIFDAADNWSTEATKPPNESYSDVQGVAAHEFGHGSGHTAHWDAAATICTGAGGMPIHTMCAGAPGSSALRRSLEEHDRHTFLTAY
jgi:hypothetical protein